jgi:uncharacterized membrane protein YfcA
MTLLLLVIGVGAGILSGVFGLGGGIIVVPALIFLAKMTPQQAAGTSLAALVLPLGAFVGAVNYYRAGQLKITDGLLIALGMAGGAFIGSWVATNIDADLLRRGFAVLMVIMAVKLWFG